MNQIRRVLPADAYDTLELSAMIEGGVGMSAFFRDGAPVCIHGHAMACDVSGELRNILYRAALNVSTNDRAVADALGFDSRGRIAFAEWCKRLNVVRGD